MDPSESADVEAANSVIKNDEVEEVPASDKDMNATENLESAASDNEAVVQDEEAKGTEDEAVVQDEDTKGTEDATNDKVEGCQSLPAMDDQEKEEATGPEQVKDEEKVLDVTKSESEKSGEALTADNTKLDKVSYRIAVSVCRIYYMLCAPSGADC